MVVKTHSVDDALVFGNAEEARLRVAGLRVARNRADFEEAETERAQSVDVFAVLSRPAASPTGLGKSIPISFIGLVRLSVTGIRPNL